ncbi:MAG TPA: hypothetical protein PLT57_09945 [Accumulibacter sp.]|nr:hypothetical protein [Accumulibacter sp.]
MNHGEQLSTGARIAIGCMAALGAMGGFQHMPYRWAKYTIFVDGAGAVAMAVIFFAMSTLALAALLQSWRATRWVYVVSLAALLVPPMVYVVAS